MRNIILIAVGLMVVGDLFTLAYCITNGSVQDWFNLNGLIFFLAGIITLIFGPMLWAESRADEE